MQELTSRQQQVLVFITSYLDEHGSPPTLREISYHIGTKGTATAIVHLEALERKGRVLRRSGSRGISLPGRMPNQVSVPLLGVVRAGLPELATEDIVGKLLRTIRSYE
jgi:repressor LexA